MPIFILAIALVLVVGTSTFAYNKSRQPKLEAVAVPKLSTARDKKRKNLHMLLLEWGDKNDTHGVGEWMRGLSADNLTTLTKDVEAYARDMGFELLWLLDGQIDDVDLYDHVNQTVFKYVQSFYLAAGFQDDMQLYTTMIEFLNNMGSRRFRPKAEAIYKRLNQEGIIPSADADMLFNNRAQRIHYIENAIRGVAQTNRPALKVAVRDSIILNTAA